MGRIFRRLDFAYQKNRRMLRVQVANQIRRFGRVIFNVFIVIAFVVVSWYAAKTLAEFVHALDLPEVVLAIAGTLASMLVVGTEHIRADAAAVILEGEKRYFRELATPDSGYFTHRAYLQVDWTKHNFLGQFLDVPKNRNEIMLVLREGPKMGWRKRPPYSLHCIQEQIEPLLKDEQLLDKLKWVCFVTRHKEFVAYMRFPAFALDVLHGKQEYETLLNISDPTEFKNKIRSHRPDLVGAVSGHVRPDQILGLNFASVPDGYSRREAMRVLIKADQENGMLLSTDGKPIGVVSMRTLADGLLQTHDVGWYRGDHSDSNIHADHSGTTDDDRFDSESEDIEVTQKMSDDPHTLPAQDNGTMQHTTREAAVS